MVEKFLSKELTCVITDQSTVTQRSASQSKGSDKLTALTSARGQSRAQAILQKSVGQRKQPGKSTDVLGNASKWGIRIKSVEQALKWINTQLQKKPQDTTQSKNRVYSLREAFLKVEDHSRQYKPLIKELRGWPHLNLDAPPGFSPFDEPVSMRTRSHSSSRSPRKVVKRAANKSSAGSTDKKGYCELCDTHYRGMQKHVNSRGHKLLASREDTYAELDRLIARGKTLKEFEDERIRKRSSRGRMQTRSRTRSRSPVSPKPTPQKGKTTSSKTTSPKGGSWRTASQQRRSATPGERSRSIRSKTSSPARKTSSSPRKAQKKVTPIKIVRFQDNGYSVVKSTAKKRRRDQSDNTTSHAMPKRKRTDRFSIVEATPMKIRLRRSKRKSSQVTRASLFVGRLH